MLLPRPTALERTGVGFEFGQSTIVATSDRVGAALDNEILWLQDALRPATGLALYRSAGPAGRSASAVATAPTMPDADGPSPQVWLDIDPALSAEGYRLTTGPTGAQIVGGGPAGVFYGCQALRQLLPPKVFRRARASDASWTVPGVQITDAPRFRWRGALLDVARHFLPKADLLRFLDLMALHRLNVLHLHLTDDQGWRVQIRRFPRLTDIGGWRRESQVGAGDFAGSDGRPHGGFYTKDDIAEIVGYAAARHITVVPEIDLPGHSGAAIAAYPELGVTGAPLDVWTRWGVNQFVVNLEQSTVDFCCAVLDEIVDMFPSRYIGIGGDECPTELWAADPRTQQLLRRRGLATETDGRAWFVGQLAAHLAGASRLPYGWDELLDGDLPAGTLVAAWRQMGAAVTAAARGYDVVSCPVSHAYLDFRQSADPDEPVPIAGPLSLRTAYEFDPVPEGLSTEHAARILGGQANIWTEHIDSPRVLDYQAFPRLCGIAEALWSSAPKDFPDFAGRLEHHLRRLDAIGVEYRHSDGPRPWQRRPGVPGRPADENLSSPL